MSLQVQHFTSKDAPTSNCWLCQEFICEWWNLSLHVELTNLEMLAVRLSNILSVQRSAVTKGNPKAEVIERIQELNDLACQPVSPL